MTITITNTRTKTSYINYIQLKRQLAHEARLIYAPAAEHEARLIYAPAAEHRHAAGLIDLLFKGRITVCFTAALPYKQVVNKRF